MLIKPSFPMHIKSPIETISLDRSDDRNLTSDLFRLASFTPKHRSNRLISKLPMNLEMSSAIFSDFFYPFYLNLLKKKVRLLVSFPKRCKLVNFTELFGISLMRQDFRVYKRDFLKLIRSNTGLTVLLKDLKHLIQMLKLYSQSSSAFMTTKPL